NLGKFAEGGYVPILLGAAVLAVMLVWNRGRTLLAERSRTRFESWNSACALVQQKLATRVPGTAVFMTSTSDMLPGTLVRHVERSRSLHETVILVTVRIVGSPVVSESERCRVERLPGESGEYYHRVIIQFGFMEEPHVIPVLKKAVRAAEIPFH